MTSSQVSRRGTSRSALLITSLLTGLALVAPAESAEAATAGTFVTEAKPKPWPGHPGRLLVTHVVKRGETPSGLAVRYHAWTRELLAINGIRDTSLIAGRTIRIPVVIAAVQKAQRAAAHKPKPRASSPSRTQVRRMIVAIAKRQKVPPKLALAVGWQESGWQQHLTSSAGAIGVMQVLPGTGRWMSQYAGRPLKLRQTPDNIFAGVLLLKVLRNQTRTDAQVIAAYYQGLGALRRNGVYPVTKPYVANVQALRRALQQGWLPA